MAKGEQFPAEWRTFADDQTGVEIRQLTNYKGHSHHLYFTNPGWYDNGRRLLFGADRDNRTKLFSVDLLSGELTQLTDRDQPPPPAETSFLFASVNPRRDEVYYWHGRELVALDLHSCRAGARALRRRRRRSHGWGGARRRALVGPVGHAWRLLRKAAEMVQPVRVMPTEAELQALVDELFA